ncbi:MAG TPA: biopolymer transporter ExbD [Algoriphagus sp.]|mgnify:FL=1|jgi:biopolymer transport protein ExbD|uniref:Biopolymer transport protein ExbD n=1 Tax=Algoriphagus ornithinivorans TaxID=226506 RepID=A0A1I5AE22_9BACT|nr:MULTISPECIES: biopolymer transporter ExbD [Algoriphagus]MAL15116.1 biopolymer transporter ExbD [Algoriphagus sp.]MAN87881.1 biopolymer transporter ExbD [Algoriphagus sp.]QYH39682.1 biopolymer transporter ExbD [Algoriphagus sp. NBT04N3]SFN60726.1 Biopolymer transport protein ExbD [Algoriphagus ornithinivorans]HAD51666.1 biopolymer transporter ExbD [Algoriphagus sp.]|tara:strand:- start:6755 stop:7219 length:465 start_codon:yes stop_codon:yes gene_type:complete
MAKFSKKTKTSENIPTSALPDIIFMLLFFFMVTTVLREQEILVEQKIPQATQLQKLQKKTLISYIYIGKPKNTGLYGSEPRVQANDALLTPADIVQWVNQERDMLPEADRNMITISMKIDRDVKMGPISDVQTELREADARRVLYASVGKVQKD